MPQTLALTQFIAFYNAHQRYSALDNRVDPLNLLDPLLPPLKGYDHYPNGTIELKELYDLDALLDKQTFQAPWPHMPPGTFAALEHWAVSCGLYDNILCRWKDFVPGLPVNVLVSVYRRIIDGALDHFINRRAGANTTICSTASYAPPACHHSFKAMPSLAICASRRSSGTPGAADLGIDSGFSSHISPIEVVLEGNFVEGHEVLQLAAYARQYFHQEPGRYAVRCLILTDNTVRIYVFDSNGLLSRGAMNVHERPVEFLWSVVQFSWTAARTSTAYDFNHDKLSQRGWKRYCLIPNVYVDPQGIMNKAPIYRSDQFIGRRTVCWKLSTSDGRAVIVKNFSVYYDPTANMFMEWQFLHLLQDNNIAGVGRMFKHTEEKMNPPSVDSWTPRNLVDPVFPMQFNMRCMLLMEYYDKSILDFNGRTELLYVLRDAIKTHKNLWMKGIWHDDIRPDNIRISCSGEPENGLRAVIIGFARAKFVDPMAGDDIIFNWDHAGRDKDSFRSRTRPMRIAPWYGYLHDLESFLLVLASMCCFFHRPHAPRVSQRVLRNPQPEWDSPDYLNSRDSKSTFLSQFMEADGNVHRLVARGYFGRVFVDLIAAWTVWLDSAFSDAPEKGEMKLAQTEGHYCDVLDMVDTAIRRVEEEEKDRRLHLDGCLI